MGFPSLVQETKTLGEPEYVQTSRSGWPTIKVVSLSFLVKLTGSERSNVGVRNGWASCCVDVKST